MANSIESLEQLIAGMEAEKTRVERALDQLRATLRDLKGEDAKPARASSPPFQRKYDSNAREVIAGVLKESGRPMHVGQILEILLSKGYDYKKQTIAVSLAKMHENREVSRVRAPSGSNYSFAYAVVSANRQEPIRFGGAA